MTRFFLTALTFGIAGSFFSQTPWIEENFDAYQDGDTIVNVAPGFILWSAPPATPNGPSNPEEHAFVTNQASFSGANSMRIEATSPQGSGPMDVLLVCNLPGSNEFTFKALVPTGYSGYYNFQGLTQVGQNIGVWAFDCFMNSDGTLSYLIDPNDAEGIEISTTYNHGQWVEFSHQIDADAGTMNILVDGECIGEFPYISDLVGHINFYPTSMDNAPALYYVDDISIIPLDALPDCGIADVQEEQMEMTFGPNPAKETLRITANFDKAVVRILALNGQVVFEDVRSDLRGGTEVDLNLDNGIYLLELNHDMKRSTQRLVIQK